MGDEILILLLPIEVLEHIFSNEILDARDVVNVSTTCRLFRDASLSNKVWKVKFHQRWREFTFSKEELTGSHWYKEYKTCHVNETQIAKIISTMSSKWYKSEIIPDSGYDDIVAIMKSHRNGPTHVSQALRNIINYPDSWKRLTERYYAEQALSFIGQCQLDSHLLSFLMRPPQGQLLETGAVILAKWFQPGESFTSDKISLHLNDLASKVQQQLRIKHDGLPVCSHAIKVPLSVGESLWSPEHCSLVLKAMNSVLFDQLGFHGNSEDYYRMENSFINKVLEQQSGIPITLCIVYMSVALRLGVVCEPVNFPSHFLLRWLQRPFSTGTQKYTYIDVFNKGRFLTHIECGAILGAPFSSQILEGLDVATPTQVLQRMGRNLMNIARQPGAALNGSTLEGLLHSARLAILLDPRNEDARILGAKLNHHMDINHKQSLQWLEECSPHPEFDALQTAIRVAMDNQEKAEQEEDTIEVKMRSDHPEVEYSIGIIMKHRRYHYIGVIQGWDGGCEASDEWVHQMGVLSLPRGRDQPFYNVLVDDGSSRYVAEDNVDFAPEPATVSNPAVRKYFEEFCGTFYKPNAEKAAHYPDDLAATARGCRERYA